jgi:FkbM family methyltransferase
LTRTVTLNPRNGRTKGPPRARLFVSVLRALALPFALINFRGYSRACSTLAKVCAPGLEIVVQLNAETQFSFPADDVYWVRLVTTRFPYEQDIERVLKLISDQPFTLIDCGANYGYWSCLVSGETFGAHPTVAVEASSSTMARLTANSKINGNRFTCEQYAICDAEGKRVRLGGNSHASRSIMGAMSGEEITTTTIEAIAARHGLTGAIVIKLDVEGAEVPAMLGMTTLMDRDMLLLYEDHGHDPSCAPSRFLMERGWTLYDLSGERPRRLPDLAAVARLKRNVRHGYNFAAERGTGWLSAHAAA